MTWTVAEIELSDPWRPIAPDGGQGLAALARWRGRPLGWVRIPPGRPAAGADAIADEVRSRLGPELVGAVLAEGEPSPPEAPPISVVVCTRDRPALLERCLGAIAALDYPAYELLVIDNAPSDDAAREVVSRFEGRYVREDRRGLDWARNRGIAEATHDIVAFTDDDAVVDSRWLRGFAAAFAIPGVMGVTGLVAPLELATEAQVLFEHVYGGMGKGVAGRLFHRDLLRPSRMVAVHAFGVGANMAFRKATFDRLGGFDTALDVGTPAGGGGDLDMFHRLVAGGLALWYEPRALVWHQHRREMDALRRQLYDDGRSFAVYLLKLLRTGSVPRHRVVRYALWTWGPWLGGRVVLGLLGRHPLPLPLLWAGLRGALDAPAAYLATYREDRRTRARLDAARSAGSPAA
jgi:glycosyltransferase involved in cell wall biosynthesis